MSLPLLPSFLIAGFECSTPINRDNRRIDELALTQHDRHVREDYRRLREQEICVARDGVRWNLVDRRGRLDFSSAIPFLEAAEQEGITVIWDLFHYGYPQDLDPFTESFITRFAAYCRAFACLVAARSNATPFYTPVNEISYFAWAGGDQGVFGPHATGRGPELKRQLARAAIAGMNTILEIQPHARFVHCEPLVRVVAPADRPDLAGEAEYFNIHAVHEAWDILGGIEEPELGGSPRLLDIIGVNYYGYNQWEHQRPDNVLVPDDPRRMPFSEMLRQLYARYRKPMIVSETSSHGDFRSGWLREIGEQCVMAIKSGVALHGLCLYPVIDMFDWHARHHTQPLSMGLWELCPADDDANCLQRVPHKATLAEVRRLQARVEALLPG